MPDVWCGHLEVFWGFVGGQGDGVEKGGMGGLGRNGGTGGWEDKGMGDRQTGDGGTGGWGQRDGERDRDRRMGNYGDVDGQGRRDRGQGMGVEMRDGEAYKYRAIMATFA